MLYSIIIPHFNSAILLQRLLKSIPANGHFQIIVVDDNSSEKEYNAVVALKDKFNFELYKNERTTAGGARNTGLKHVASDWILFADADDYFEIGFEEHLCKYIDSDYDLIFFNVSSRYSSNGELAYRNEHILQISSKAISESNMDYLKCCYTAPWGKMYNKRIVDNIYFDEVIAGNDMWFSVNTGLRSNKVVWDPFQLYCVTVTPNSITTTLSKDRFESRLQVTLRINQLLRDNGKRKFQISVLYFLSKSYQFGFRYFCHVIKLLIVAKSNPFIGIGKLFHFREVLKDRQNIHTI